MSETPATPSVLDQYLTDFETLTLNAIAAGETPATLARVVALGLQALFAEKLAEDPDDLGLFNALRAEHIAAESLTKSMADGD